MVRSRPSRVSARGTSSRRGRVASATRRPPPASTMTTVRRRYARRDTPYADEGDAAVVDDALVHGAVVSAANSPACSLQLRGR